MRKNIGNAEWHVMQCILDRHPISVRDVARQIAKTRGLARTSVLTVMERLRDKGHLKRKRKDGVWVYFPKKSKDVVLREVVKDFVETRLQGALSPFMAYLAEETEVDEQQLQELRQLVVKLEMKQERRRKFDD